MQQNEVTEMKYAGFWFRAIAAIVDIIISQITVGIIAFPLGMALGASMTNTSTQSEIQAVAGGLGMVLGIFVQWLYFTVSESSSWQATLGKKMFGLNVTDMEGNKIGFGKANSRYWLKMILGMILLAGFVMVTFTNWSKIISAIILLIVFIMVALTEKKQGLHDIIAGTLVVKKV